MDKKQHWENVFSQKQQNEVSWFQPLPKSSIVLFEEQQLPKDARIIDVGSGDSYFIDYLLENGYENVTALDISELALLRLKKRLGSKGQNVNYMVSDVLDFKPTIHFDYWHDRAAFHFLTTEEEINNYIATVNSAVKKNGKLMLATFSETGPLKCSGLPIKQYSKDELSNQFSGHFEKIKCIDESHLTPFDTVQDFTFCTFKKAA